MNKFVRTSLLERKFILCFLLTNILICIANLWCLTRQKKESELKVAAVVTVVVVAALVALVVVVVVVALVVVVVAVAVAVAVVVVVVARTNVVVVVVVVALVVVVVVVRKVLKFSGTEKYQVSSALNGMALSSDSSASLFK